MSHHARRLSDLTTVESAEFSARHPSCVLLSVGSVEPHGPHLPLGTDTLISERACDDASRVLADRGVTSVIAPTIPYGVTDFAEGFSGAIGVPADVLTSLLAAVCARLLQDGWDHVALVNNHLEPAHDAAVRAVVARFPSGRISVSCPLTRRWARTLSDEFKKGNCHAGRYETSLVLAAGKGHLPAPPLPSLAISLSDGIKAGQHTFREMGMTAAYTGAPSEASAGEGEELYEKLREMVVTEVLDALAVLGIAIK